MSMAFILYPLSLLISFRHASRYIIRQKPGGFGCAETSFIILFQTPLLTPTSLPRLATLSGRV